MNQQVIEKVGIFNSSPKYIDGVFDSFDRTRMYDIAIALYETKESLEDLKQYLRENLSSEFMHRDKVLNDCIQSISTIYFFLEYYNNRWLS